jgi:general secretion pathway protein G
MTYAHRSAKAGFTLIEILIAVAIVALLAFVVAPNIFRFLENAKRDSAKLTLKNMKNAIMLYNTHIGQWPTKLRDLIEKPRDEKMAKKWRGPYLEIEEIPEDPWFNSYQYKVTPGAAHAYELYSYGSGDGKATPKTEWIDAWKE